MLTQEQRELFQKDKYELVDMIVSLRKKLKSNGTLPEEQNKTTWTVPNKLEPPVDAIAKSLNKLNKEMGYGNKEETSKAFKEEC